MTRVTFGILGPFEVRVDGELVPIVSTRQRIVLAMLLMSPNRVVSVDKLIDAVWDGRPPRSARSQVQICISALRRAINVPEVIWTTPDGYFVAVQDDQVDSSTFNAALDRGHVAVTRRDWRVALEHLDKAHALWRGPALVGLPGRAIEMHANPLEERRLMAIEDRVEVRLGLGEHRELVDELVALTDDYPLRERLRGFQMIALYRSGRQAEALDAYHKARQVLKNELGLEPGTYLQKLERGILTQASVLEVDNGANAGRSSTVRLPQQLPADTPDFVGRQQVVDNLVDLLTGDQGADGKSGAIPAILITGPAGSGKSAVAIHVAHRVRDRFPDGHVFVNLHGSTATPMPTSEALSRIFQAIGVERSAVPAGREEQIKLLRTQLAGQRLLMVFDDVADECQIDDLLPGVPGPALLMTSRGRLAMLSGVHTTKLSAMSHADSIRMLARIVGASRTADMEQSLATLAQMCDRLPLALSIAAMRLVASPHWSVDTLVALLADEARRLDELRYRERSVRAVLNDVYRTLSPEAQDLLQLLGALDMPNFSPIVCAALMDVDSRTCLYALDDLIRAGVVETVFTNGDLTGYHLHSLTGVFAREQLGERPAGEVTKALERAFGCMLALAEQACQRLYGNDNSMLVGDGYRWPGARPHFDNLLSEPMSWFDARREGFSWAVARTAELGMTELCWELAVAVAALCEYGGTPDDGQRVLEIAMNVVGRSGSHRGQVALLSRLGVDQLADAEQNMLLEALATFEEVDDIQGQALALRTLAHLDRARGRTIRAARRFERALQQVRMLGDRAAQVQVVIGLAGICLDRGNLEQAEALAKEALLRSQQVENRALQAEALHRLGEVMFSSSLTLAADAIFRVSRSMASLPVGRIKPNLEPTVEIHATAVTNHSHLSPSVLVQNSQPHAGR